MDERDELQPDLPSNRELPPAAHHRSLPHFTHITVSGCNLLGLVNIFFFIGLLTIAASQVLPEHRPAGVALLVIGAIACSAFDLWMRMLTDGRSRAAQFISPHAGGALLYFPVWAVYPVFALAIPLIILFRR